MVGPVRRSGSIITRLTLIVTGILTTAILGVGTLALVEQHHQLNQALNTKASALVQFMAEVTPLSILSLNFVELNSRAKAVVLTDDEAVYAVILNEYGIPLTHFFKTTDPVVTEGARELERDRKPLAAIDLIKKTGEILEVPAQILSGEKRIGTATLGFSTRKMKQAVQQQIAVIGLFLLVIIGASNLLLRIILQRILRPIRALTTAATQISTGHLNVELSGTERKDEVGVLANAFGSMAKQLASLIAGMELRERDLHRLNAFQRTLLNNIPYGIISTTPDGTISSLNPAAERLFGYSATEVIGQQLPANWYDAKEMEQRADVLAREYGQTARPGFDVLAARARHGLTYENEWTIIRKDGTRVPTLLTVTALRSEDGQISGFVGMTYDLSERKRSEIEKRESEARYRRIVDTAIEGICTVDVEANITFVNARMAEMLGYSSAEMIGKPLTILLFPEDLADNATKMENRRKGFSENYERRFRRKNGDEVWTLASATPVFDEKGVFRGSFGMFSDITERKGAEEELRRLKDELEQRVRDRTAELEEKNAEMERMNKVFVGRELRMVELKNRIEELEQQLNRSGVA